jgi:Putative zinc binding domain
MPVLRRFTCGFVDLGMSPLCESHLAKDQLNSMEPLYPLAAYVCRDCLLVQLQEYLGPEVPRLGHQFVLPIPEVSVI